MSKPATSVHLWWRPNVQQSISKKCIIIECDVKVKATQDHTYFCCIGFQSGGYCGIQQLGGSDKRVAIFSLWNEGENHVEEQSHGDGVKVSEFGGEGTGLKSMKDFQWTVGTSYPIKVTSECKEDGYYVSCSIAGQHMATYKRAGRDPVGYLYSFVEDFNWWENPNGYQIHRELSICNMRYTIDGVQTVIEEIKFTKVRNEADGCNFTGAYVEGKAFCLWTGGQCDKVCGFAQLLRLC